VFKRTLTALAIGATLFGASAHAENAPGLKHPFTAQEQRQFRDCLDATAAVMADPPFANHTMAEVMGPDLTRLVCACAAVRQKNPEDAGAAFRFCARAIILNPE